MSQCGWRQLTPGLHFAEKMAREEGVRASVSKSVALVAFKKAAPYLGINQGDILIMDTLVAFSKDQDWEEGASPIVWPSNSLLMERCGLGLRSLQRRLRGLSELGFIAFKDSPNGQRYGKRDGEGCILEAYGFDLSPLAVRAQELEDLYHAMSIERQACQRLKRSITILRRSIRMSIETAIERGLSGAWSEKFRSLTTLISEIAVTSGQDMLAALKEKFTALQEEVMKLYERALGALNEVFDDIDEAQEDAQVCKASDSANENINMTPMDDSNDVHILTTNQHPPVICNGTNVPKSCNEKNEGNSPSVQEQKPLRKPETSVYPNMILEACPTFADFVSSDSSNRANWREITNTAGKLTPMMGISPDAWNCARSAMGAEAAAIALAITLEKHTAGEVKNPGGYLRGMTEKAENGQLHLTKSIFGRL